MDVTFGIITAPRKVNLISQSLGTFLDVWGEDQIVHTFAEPGAEHFQHCHKTILHKNPNRFGVFWNWVYMARWFRDNVRTQWFGFCEDDIQWCENAKEEVQKIAYDYREKPIGLISAYTSKLNGHPEPGWGEAKITPQIGMCGALALFFRRDTLSRILEHHIMLNYQNEIDLDHRIGRATKHYQLPIINHNPTLVYHLGVDDLSTLHVGKPFLKEAREPYE